jgi:hypothetical protein
MSKTDTDNSSKIDNWSIQWKLQVGVKAYEEYNIKCNKTSDEFDKTYNCTELAEFLKQLGDSTIKDLNSLCKQ